jgi:two-component system phosphate regulon response regulator PhoB/two-component system alkaline phosphatase synthesis response regulator PhoP
MAKILVAEDDKFLANAYRVKLTKSGYEVVIAQDGNQTLEALKTFKADLILLDLMMPVKDGFTTLQEIKSDPSLKNIPVIIASNLGQKEDIDRGLALGARDYVVKSDLSLDELIKKIHTIIN